VEKNSIRGSDSDYAIAFDPRDDGSDRAHAAP